MKELLAFSFLLLLLADVASGNSVVLDFVGHKVEAGSVKEWDLAHVPKVAVVAQTGSKAEVLIQRLPGQPKHTPVRQYSGYVKVNEKAGRSLFYYFTEVRERNTTYLPLILWMNGGPGCSSVGAGALLEHGPFLVNGKSSVRKNKFPLSTMGHVIYLDTPVGTGFSYSDTPSDYKTYSDLSVAEDNLNFLVNWLERFPFYKGRDLYLAGEGYAGNYLPQLAQLILNHNNATNTTVIKLKGLLLGNPVIDSEADVEGVYETLWSHGMISTKMIENIRANCNSTTLKKECYAARQVASKLAEPLYLKDITASVCIGTTPPSGTNKLDVDELYECKEKDVASYLSSPEVQKALHVNPAKAPKEWQQCNSNVAAAYGEITPSTLPILQSLLSNRVSILVFSGDADVMVPTMSSRLSLKKLKLTVRRGFFNWYWNRIEMSGYAETYWDGLAFASVKGAGHMVAKTKANEMLNLFRYFMSGTMESN